MFLPLMRSSTSQTRQPVPQSPPLAELSQTVEAPMLLGPLNLEVGTPRRYALPSDGESYWSSTAMPFFRASPSLRPDCSSAPRVRVNERARARGAKIGYSHPPIRVDTGVGGGSSFSPFAGFCCIPPR